MTATPPFPPRAFYLTGFGGDTLAFFHDSQPAGDAVAVLLCPPFGWDDMCSYRSRRAWAEHLAGGGRPAMRIDLPASGDSAGEPDDGDLVPLWTRAVSESAAWLRDRTACRRVIAIGIGLGGILATCAVADGAPIDELVLWSTPARGRVLTRELRAFARLEAGNIVQPGEPTPPELAAGALAANGYLMSSATNASLERLDLGSLDLSAVALRRALLLGRRDARVDPELAGALRSAGADLRVASGAGYESMMLEPQDARAPVAVFEIVDDWIAAAPAPPNTERAPAREPRGPTTSDRLSIRRHGASIVERPFSVPTVAGELFGVLCRPEGTERELTVLLLNAGPQRRTGPNRMWVEIARRWAERGIPSLRLDFAGIGDSPGDSDLMHEVAALYAGDFGDQAVAALDALQEHGLPPRFLTAGLCSGAYWSLHTALADERVVAAFMLNPRTLRWDEWTHARRRLADLWQRARDGTTWRRVVRGQVDLYQHLQTARATLRHFARAAGPVHEKRGEAPAAAVVEELFGRLAERAQGGLVLFTGSEPLRNELEAEGALQRACRSPGVELAIRGTSADTHTLAPIWLQQEVHALLDRTLERVLEASPAGAGGAGEAITAPPAHARGS